VFIKTEKKKSIEKIKNIEGRWERISGSAEEDGDVVDDGDDG